mgnify:CR=1 FL=1
MNFIKYFYKFLANGIGFNSMVVMIESKMILKEALAILDHPLISERYFFPFRTVFDRPYMIPVKEATLGSYLYRAKSGRDARTVVLFHGNGEVVSDYFDTYLPIFVDLG